MRYIIEVLEDWPSAVKERGSFKHRPTSDACPVVVLNEDGISGSAGVLQGPGFEDIPKGAVIRIRQLDN
ncbi:hypothetical protein [Luteibacter sp.]|uniref:hypothetical protein n=1 Tax=Luteibacter sp. TaxID=1886636 RepID=UPI00280825F3|nr:hypothetical protein [Luteibacter sp.]MDQ8048087.1 hypothetical protein [Luteibacter sp.]